MLNMGHTIIDPCLPALFDWATAGRESRRCSIWKLSTRSGFHDMARLNMHFYSANHFAILQCRVELGRSLSRDDPASFCALQRKHRGLHRASQPLVTVVTCLFSHRSSGAVGTLPGPLSVGGTLARLSAKLGPGSCRMRWPRNGAIVVLGAWCYFLLLPIFQKHYSIMACIVYTITRSLSFALLEACREHELSPFNNELSFLPAAEAISFRVFCITAGCMLILPSQNTLKWPMLVQALGNAVKQGAVFILVRGSRL